MNRKELLEAIGYEGNIGEKGPMGSPGMPRQEVVSNKKIKGDALVEFLKNMNESYMSYINQESIASASDSKIKK